MLINKIGFEHLFYGSNCQDFALDLPGKKCVVDGCSQGLHSEIGSKLFVSLFEQGLDIDTIFGTLTKILSSQEQIKNYLLFTVLILEETEEDFVVHECGDGYIIKQTVANTLEYEKTDYGGAPPYYAYNYINKNKLSLYKDGVSFKIHRFSKDKYRAVGIATDGIEYILKSPHALEFEKCLLARKPALIKRMINMNHNYQYAVNTLPQNILLQYVPESYNNTACCFKDDISIVI